ncbi:SDR family NAD(P)-dependent oxidoreductase [Rhodopseudomonas palustris]|uniref:Short-chain dehydrogenase/reductase SDR n=1 Tax=Rhodopseudomonas palustris (strain BisB18) TaxID=316056 RepID=Q20YQ3_RHOPB
MTRRIAIFGAASGIAVQVARLYAERGDSLVLIGRSDETLSSIAQDLTVRGAPRVQTILADFASLEQLPDVLASAWNAFDGLDIAVVAYGTLPDQKTTEVNSAALINALLINFASPAVVVNMLAERFQPRGAGTIAVITSVAGERGRQSNYAYGSAKGGLQRFLEGVRHRLKPAGIAVIDIRPGFVSTPMTSHLDQRGLMWARPERVAKDIVASIDHKVEIVYTPTFWRWIMLAVRNLPRPLFHRTKL